MVKLSQQSQQQRPTRTQRVQQQQTVQKERGDFNTLKKRAEAKREEFGTLGTIDEYETKYKKLDPELQQFFSTPQTLRTERTERIATTKTTVSDKIDFANKKIADARTNRDKNLSSARNKYSTQNRSRDWLDAREEKYENSFDESEAKWTGYIKGLNKGLQELNQNKDVEYKNIENYASDIGLYERQKEEAKNEKRTFNKKQEDEVRKMKEAGFKPQIIQESFKGQPKSVGLKFYNPTTQEWRNVKNATYNVKSPINVAGLKRLGFSAPQTRTLSFAGKDYKFTSNVGIYKTPKGDIVTPYEQTGITEQQLIKEQQDIAYAEFQKTRKPSISSKVVPFKDLPVGYGGQQSVSTQPRNVIFDEDVYYQQQDKKVRDLGLSKVLGAGAGAFKWVDERIHFKLGTTPIIFGKLDQPTDYERSSIELESGLEMSKEKLREFAINQGKVDDLSESLETKYSEQYQTSFENKYMKSLIYGETTFDKASQEFAGSKEAKNIQRRYGEEYGQGYKEIDQSTSLGKKLVAGGGMAFLSGGQFLFKASRSPTRFAGTTIGVYGGVKALNLIPPVASYGLSGGLFAFGTYKAFSPTSTIEEAGGGLITAVISGATLGYGAYRHLKTPVIKRVKIPAPKMKLKASETIGADVKLIKNQVTKNLAIYPKQKLSQFGVAGKRTIVTTKGKLLSKSFWEHISGRKLALDDFAVYRGIPSKQLATKIKIPKLFGVKGSGKQYFQLTVKQSGYAKASKLLKSYGWTDAQATATLRYTAPRVYEQELLSGKVFVQGSKATGQFTHLTKRPIITVDKKLGIKTSGGKTIRDVTDFERKIVSFKGRNFVFEDKTRVSAYLKGEKIYKFKGIPTSTRGISISKASKTLKGTIKDGVLLRDVTYKDIGSISANRDIFPSSRTINVGFHKTKLYDQVIDLSQKNTFTKATGIKKTPLSKTFGGKKDIEKAIFEVTGKSKSSNEINKMINKLDDIGARASTGQTQSQYFGKGLYEKTDLQAQLRTAISPPAIKTSQIKNLIQIKQLDKVSVLQTGQLASMTSLGLKTGLKFKTSLKVENSLKNLLKSDTALKVKQIPALKSDTVLKSQLKSILDLTSPVISTTKTPSYRPPSIPKITPPKTIPFAILFPTAKSKGGKKGKRKGFNEFAFLPDFTTRALGLEEETLTGKQAQAKIKKILTGLEIRRGARVKR